MIGSLRPGRRGGPLPFVCLLSGSGGEGGGGGGGTRSGTVWEEGRGGAHVGERFQLREARVQGAPLTPVLAAFFGPPSRLSLVVCRLPLVSGFDLPQDYCARFLGLPIPSIYSHHSEHPSLHPSAHPCIQPPIQASRLFRATVLGDGDTDTNSHGPCLPSTVQETHKQVLGSQEY